MWCSPTAGVDMGYELTSSKSPRIVHLAKLRDSSYRREHGQFVVEGRRLISRALAAGLQPVEIFAASEVGWSETITTVAPDVLDRVSYRKRSEGELAVFPLMETGLELLEAVDDGVVLVAENIEKPGNLGAMLRTASAAGCRAMVTTESVDVHNPNTIRSSTGAVFDMPVIQTTWGLIANWASTSGFNLVGAVVEGGSPLWDINLTQPTAVIVGGEDTGLSSEATNYVDELVTIPQLTGSVDSLNVSVAVGILLFEAVRQRR